MDWPMRKNLKALAFLVVAVFVTLLGVLLGCSPQPSSNPIHYFVLIDETASAADQFDRAILKTSELCGKTGGTKKIDGDLEEKEMNSKDYDSEKIFHIDDPKEDVVSETGIINGDDTLTIIGVDNKSYDKLDVRLDIKFDAYSFELDERLKDTIHNILKIKIRESSSGFGDRKNPKGTPKGTDLEGALNYAASLVKPEDKQVRVIVMGDLQDNPKYQSKKEPQRFPVDTKAMCLFIQTPKGNQKSQGAPNNPQQLLALTQKRWEPYLNQVGLTSVKYFLAGNSKSVNFQAEFPN